MELLDAALRFIFFFEQSQISECSAYQDARYKFPYVLYIYTVLSASITADVATNLGPFLTYQTCCEL